MSFDISRPCVRKYSASRFQFFRLKLFREFVIFRKRVVGFRLYYFLLFDLSTFPHKCSLLPTYIQIKQKVESLFNLGRCWKKREYDYVTQSCLYI